MMALSDHSGECIIVDASCYSRKEQEEFDQYIYENNLKPVRLINTHGHVDHVLGDDYIKKKYNISLELHKDDYQLYARARNQGLIFGLDLKELPEVDNYLNDGDEIQIGRSILKVLHVPGHSPGSIALYCPDQKFVIVGDVLFNGSIGRTDLPGGNHNQLIQSIFNKLLVLPPETEVIPGHGPTTTIEAETHSNPFLI